MRWRAFAALTAIALLAGCAGGGEPTFGPPRPGGSGSKY